jgi:MotA/TolQ/ExbB proton channel family
MATNSSQRPTRELPLLVLALALVLAVCVPLRQWITSSPADDPRLSVHAAVGAASKGAWRPPDEPSRWSADRLTRMLLGPEQIACYCCFAWAAFILVGRYSELRRQRRAFGLQLLSTDAGVCILPEDARLLQRKVEQTARGGPYILVTMIRLALGKYAVSRSGRDVSETIRTQADVDLGRLVTSMATVHYLAWAIPALGFLGTVRGLAMSLSMAGHMDLAIEQFLGDATRHLNTAFDCTLIALALSLPVMFLIHSVQRDEESLVIDCQQYCLEHLVNRLCDPEPLPAAAVLPQPSATPRVRISR